MVWLPIFCLIAQRTQCRFMKLRKLLSVICTASLKEFPQKSCGRTLGTNIIFSPLAAALPVCLSYFSFCWGKIPHSHKLKEEWFISAQFADVMEKSRGRAGRRPWQGQCWWLPILGRASIITLLIRVHAPSSSHTETPHLLLLVALGQWQQLYLEVSVVNSLLKHVCCGFTSAAWGDI